MGQVLHGSATTTEAVRRAIQRSQESARALAQRHGISPTTVQKWRKRQTAAEVAMGPKDTRSTTLTPEQEAIVVAFRRHTRLGPLGSRLLPDDYHACLQAIVERGYDFLLTFHHPEVAGQLDPAVFPHLVVGVDALIAVRSPGPAQDPIALLGYARHSFLGRVAALAQEQVGAPAVRESHVNENAMAEALKGMALAGHGLAWLPRSSIEAELAGGLLVAAGKEVPLAIRLYRNVRHTRPAVEAVWAVAGDLAHDVMHATNRLF